MNPVHPVLGLILALLPVALGFGLIFMVLYLLRDRDYYKAKYEEEHAEREQAQISVTNARRAFFHKLSLLRQQITALNHAILRYKLHIVRLQQPKPAAEYTRHSGKLYCPVHGEFHFSGCQICRQIKEGNK